MAGEHPDGGGHSYCYKSDFNTGLEANAYQAESHALRYHTQADTPYNDPCDVSGEPQTDVRWVDAWLGSTVAGGTFCQAFNGNGYCDRNDVVLNPDVINQGGNDEYDQNKTACHELGHSVGLEHGNDKTDCMINGERPSLNEVWEHYNDHHVGHINDWF